MTHSSVDYADLQVEVERLIKAKFPEGDIVSVSLREGHNDDGDRVLEITIIFDGAIDGIAERAPLSLLRDLREALSHHVVRAFPFLNFVPASGMAA